MSTQDKFFSKKSFWKFLQMLGIGCFVSGVIYLLWTERSLFSDREALRMIAEDAGVYAPLLIIAVITAEVVFAPFPGGFIPVLAGFLFGPWLGALYSYIGNVFGSMVAFLLAARFGRPLIQRLFSQQKIQEAERYLRKRHRYLILFYAIPIFPIDIISFLLGLSGLNWKKFFFITAVGFLPNIIILSFFGDYLFAVSYEILSLIGLLLFIVLLIAIIFKFKRRR